MSKTEKNNTQATPSTPTEAFRLPYEVTCSVCGAKKAVRHEVLLKRLVKHKGTLEERFIAETATYKCQNCRRADKMKQLEAQLQTNA